MKYLVLWAALLLPARALAQQTPPSDQNEAAEFLKEEAGVVVTPARQPTPVRQAPATTYIVTAEDIKLSGAVTLFDVLRMVPGVDVITERDTQGAIGIRGFASSGNRVLIMIDGRTVLDAYFDTLDWETLPLGVNEIDHVEIVEGPASALYGGNAESGVINFITKRPEQLNGGKASYTGGSAYTSIADAVYGRKSGDLGYRLGAGWRSFGRLGNPEHAASDAGRADGLLEWTPTEDKSLAVSGGIVRHNSQVFGPPTGTFDDGQTGFLRADGRLGGTTARFFWNAGRTNLTNLTTFNGPNINWDTFDATLQRALKPFDDDRLTVNGEWRRNSSASSVFGGGVEENLYSGAFEDRWQARDDLALVVGARFDHHPLAKWMFSPRGSVIWDATDEQTLRASVGQAFRYPTLLENYANFTTPILPLTPGTNAQIQLMPNPSLRPERIVTEELAWRAEFDRARAGASVFHYELKDLIVTNETPVSLGPPVFFVGSEVNSGGVRAVGYELTGEVDLAPRWTAFANYSYQSLSDEQASELFSVESPRHKGNAGLRYKSSPWSGQLWLDAADSTIWSYQPSGDLPAYAILNMSLAYRFSGRWRGLELAFGAFNLTNNVHHEIQPYTSTFDPGQGGEHERGRYTGTLSYRF